MVDKNHRLKESKVFCMAPWVSINNNPNGDIIPCCVANTEKTFGNLYDNTIEEIWNNENYKTFRKDMLQDKESSVCNRCYKEESWGGESYRTFWNHYFGSKYEDLVENSTMDDGTLNTMKLYRWDFRFNNLCNLSCIGCGPSLSSSWVDLHKRMWPLEPEMKIHNSNKNKDRFIHTIKTQSNIVEEIYFAGGEPLLHAEHYEILEELEKTNRLRNIFFTYSTNLTNLTYKNQNVIDYWKKMRKCKILISLDEVDFDRLHYIRYPSNFNEIINNVRTVNNSLLGEEQHWSIIPTWGLLNIHRIKEVAEFFYTNDLLPNSFDRSPNWESDFHNIILMFPKHLSIASAPTEWKEFVSKKIDEYEEWYKDVLIPLKHPFIKPWALHVFNTNVTKIRNVLKEEMVIDTNYVDWFRRLDEARGTDFTKTFPELSWHLTQNR